MSDFQFKQFGISQDRCAMKVGTDGVLLGAWADGGRRILDIGSGTGLISLMMAQRFPSALIVGIDMDAEACLQARENVAQSPFANRVGIENCRLQDYSGYSTSIFGKDEEEETDEARFDAIVSNPPFFVNSMKNPDNKRAMARHADTLPFGELWKGVKRLLSEHGVFSVVLPIEVVADFEAEGCISGFYLIRKCAIKTVERKAPKRCLLAFARHRKGTLESTAQTMMDSEGNRSEWYKKITDVFYL